MTVGLFVEMNQYPVSGTFSVFKWRFISLALGFTFSKLFVCCIPYRFLKSFFWIKLYQLQCPVIVSSLHLGIFNKLRTNSLRPPYPTLYLPHLLAPPPATHRNINKWMR